VKPVAKRIEDDDEDDDEDEPNNKSALQHAGREDHGISKGIL
jgi:hypothetical protein